MAENDHLSVEEQSLNLRQIIDSSPALLHTARADGSLDFFNKTWLNFVGEPLEKLLGWGWTSCIHPGDAEAFVRSMRESFAKGEPFQEIARVRRADGVYRWMLHLKVPVFDEVGTLIKWNGSSIDIDDQKRADEQLIESAQESQRSAFDLAEAQRDLRRREAYLAEAQRLSHTGSFGWKPRTGELVFSEETYRIYEYDSVQQLTLDRIIERVHPDDRALVIETAERTSSTGVAIDFTHRLLFADGRVKYLHVLAKPLRGASNEIEYAGAAIDITAAKRAEETLRKSERELRTMLEVLPAHVGVTQPDGTLDFVSQSWLDYTGFTREQAMGWSWTKAIHPEDLDREVSEWRKALASGKPLEQEVRARSADGSYRWFLNRNIPLLDEEGNVIKWYGILFDINDLKETQKALETREHELVGIIETIPSMLWSTSPTGKPTNLSRRFLEYCGLSFEEFLNSKPERCIHPDDVEEAGKAFVQAMSSGGSYSAIHRLRGTDGEYRWHHAMGEPLRDPEGNIIQWYGITFDIDEAKRAEETVRKSERELRTLIDVMPAFVGTASPDGLFDFLSESWLDYLGLTKEQGLGWGWTDTIHPEDVDRVVANWKAGLATGESVEQEMRCRRADGTYLWFLSRDVPLRDEERTIVKWYRVLTNIDALKNTEAALKMREHELLGIIDTVPSMLWSTSPTGESTHLSQRFREYWGVRFEEIANRGWVNLIHPDDREDTTNAFFRAIETGDSFNTTQRLQRADGEYRWHHSMGEPLRGPDGKIIQWYGLSIDIDERKRAEDHLRDTSNKLAKASRLATVAELAGSIAHELNQPLMSILANAQAAKRWLSAIPPNVAEMNSSIDCVIRDAHSADNTMQHIRALFKQESFDKKDVNIPHILREVVRIVQEDPKKRGIPIEYHFEESLPAVFIDQIQIQQVFINLLVNAIEALEGQDVRPLVVFRAVRTDSNRILIQVIDNGPGVDDPERIFDAFVTTKEKGMGIGLAVSRSIIEAHGGRLWAENNDTSGAAFNVALPLRHENHTTPQPQQRA
jgi:PAS domain S-box-containing protein